MFCDQQNIEETFYLQPNTGSIMNSQGVNKTITDDADCRPMCAPLEAGPSCAAGAAGNPTPGQPPVSVVQWIITDNADVTRVCLPIENALSAEE